MEAQKYTGGKLSNKSELEMLMFHFDIWWGKHFLLQAKAGLG